ncbi:CGP-CTERM sorting domain-containing protein [Pyrococcus yayanosii]|uniref:Uncharacterized protein n=1 Tax=Pyrococcus yayanosii (strain CH1 / JCM 16557) TaxID=529709 RepID=F8AJG0_PYRYC|nr:CGP-CTERM sorting domain-containing protein [Pyrococcus yayanosii]AEH25108.1 hypothetical protein PYCH_14380 [Pyrococcus yayanosii CH1]
MRKVATLLFVLLLLRPLVAAGGFYEDEYIVKAKVGADGSANLTVITFWFGSEEQIAKTYDEILGKANGSIERAMKLYGETQKAAIMRWFYQLGIHLKNVTVNVTSFTPKNMTVIVNGFAEDFARYFSYSDYWELMVDPTRGYGALTGDIKIPYTHKCRVTFIIELPKDAQVLEYPQEYSAKFNGSTFSVEGRVDGNTVIVTSEIFVKEGLTGEGLERLFGNYTGYFVRYRTSERGVEKYLTYTLSRHVRIDVLPDGRENVTIKTSYIAPQEYVNSMKLQILMRGVANVTDSIVKTGTDALIKQGVTVYEARARILGLDSEGPLVIEENYITKGFVKEKNGEYVFEVDPTFGLESSAFVRVGNEINQTVTIEINLPEGAEILEVPKPISRELKGNFVKMTVDKEGNKILISLSLHVRYGTPREDIEKMMENLTKEYIKFKLPTETKTEETEGGICGPVFFVGLALIPVLLYRSRR